MLLFTAKERRSEIKTPKTDGAMKPPSPSASEQLVLDLYVGRPSMCGLPGFQVELALLIIHVRNELTIYVKAIIFKLCNLGTYNIKINIKFSFYLNI